MTTSQINALKHLQRVGDPESKTNQKLRVAAGVIAMYLCALVLPDEMTPRSVVLGEFGMMRVPAGLLLESDPGLWELIEPDAPLQVLQLFAFVVARGVVEQVEQASRL